MVILHLFILLFGNLDYTQATNQAVGSTAPAMDSTAFLKPFNNDAQHVAEVLISELRKAVVEKGKPAGYQIRLSSPPPPKQVVTVYLNVGETIRQQIQVNPLVLNFTADNWNQPTIVNIRALDDDVAEKTQDIDISHVVHDTSGLGYHFVSGLSTVSVRVYDDDVAEVSASVLSHTQGDETAKSSSRTIFSVRLGSKPTSAVRVSMLTTTMATAAATAANRDGIAMVEPAVLTFTPDMWTTTQTFTVSSSSNEKVVVFMEVDASLSTTTPTTSSTSSTPSTATTATTFTNNEFGDTIYHHIDAFFAPKHHTRYTLGQGEQELRPGLCPSGFSCSGPNGVILKKCVAGHFCPTGNQAPSPCPNGAYCPYGASVPLPCPSGSRCPQGSAVPLMCPPGTIGNDPQRLECTPCPAGWICDKWGNTGSSFSSLLPCPRGYYCPAGTTGTTAGSTAGGQSKPMGEKSGVGAGDVAIAIAVTPPVPCPPGTHQPYASTLSTPHGDVESCVPCPAGTHAPHPGGASSCLRCPRSARSDVGDTTCTCTGANRLFRPPVMKGVRGLGKCVCLSKHVAYDAYLHIVPSGVDSTLDCQPIVYQRCTTHQVRNEMGTCIGANAADKACNAHCYRTRTTHYHQEEEQEHKQEEPRRSDVSADAVADINVANDVHAHRYGAISRDYGHCTCFHDATYGASAVTSLLGVDSGVMEGLAAYVDGNGDYVIRDYATGEERSRVEKSFQTLSSTPSTTWSDEQNQVVHRFGSCPRAIRGGEECRIILMHTNTHGLNMAVLGGVLNAGHPQQPHDMQHTDANAVHDGLLVDFVQSRQQRRRVLAGGMIDDESGLYWEPSSSRPINIETEDNTTVVSPFICITAGDKIVFTFSWYAWPVPVKDALSSWQNYDSLDPNDFFKQLHTDLAAAPDMASFEAKSTGSTAEGPWRSTLKNTVSRMSTTPASNPIWSFQHTFNDVGLYTFGSYQRKTSVLSPERFVVQVQAEGTTCSSSVSPMGTNSAGIDDGTLVLSPDWPLLGGVFGGMIGVVLLTVALLYYAREHAWGGSVNSAPKYRARNRRMPMARLHQKSSVLKVEEKEAAAKFVTERKMERPGKEHTAPKVAGPTIPQMMAGVSGADGGDLDRWDADDLDLRELLERLESNREEVVDRVVTSDKLAQDLTKQVLKALKEESEEIKHLIAQTALENGDDETKQKSKLFKLLEQELTSRNKYDKRACTVEDSSIQGLDELRKVSGKGEVEIVADRAVEEIVKQDLSNPSTCRSKSIQKIAVGVSGAARIIQKLISMFDGERKRRIKGITMWNAAVQNGTVDLGPDLTHHLEKLRTLDERADKLSRDLVLTLRSFADGAPSFGSALVDTSKDAALLLSSAFSKRSRSEMDKSKRESSGNVAMLLGELDGALEKLGLHATSVNKQLIESRVVVHAEREMILDMLHALRMNEHLSDMGLDHNDEGDDDGSGSMANRHDREQKKMNDDIKKKEEERVKALESQLRAQAARQKSLADEASAVEQEAAAQALKQHDLTEETANKILQQYKDDANVVGDMLANERRRQAEVMRARLAEQRFRRKKNLSKTHEDEVKEQEVLTKQSGETKDLHDKQEDEYKKVVDELQSGEGTLLQQQEQQDLEEEGALSSLKTIEEVNAFEIRLKQQIATVADSDPDQRRRLERLLSKLEFKKIEIQKRSEAKELVEGAKARNDEAEVERIKQKFARDMQLLAKSADAEKRRQKASLQDRLQKKRERRMRDLQHKHEQELQQMTDSHQTEASEIQDRLDDHDDLARIIHEVKSEADGEEDLTVNAEAEALEDEQARMREELRKKQEEEASKVQEEEQEDSVIDAIKDPYALQLTALRIENDMQKEGGVIGANIYDRRVQGYNQIDSKVQMLLKKREELVQKKRSFAAEQPKNSANKGDPARRNAEVARIEEMVRRLDAADVEVRGMLTQADADMERTRGEAMEKIHNGSGGAGTPRGGAKNQMLMGQVAADLASKQVTELRQSGADTDSIKQAEIKAAAAFEKLEKWEKDYEDEAEKARGQMSDRHQRQRDRMLVKLEAKKRKTNRMLAEKKRIEQSKKRQSAEEMRKKEEELKAQGRLNEVKVAELQAEAKARMIEHEAHLDEQTSRRKQRMQQRMQAKRNAKKNAMKRKHEEELAKELAAQESERKKLEGMSQREREMKMLEGIMVRGANEERVDEAIEMIMHDRHAEETASLITTQYEERTRVIRQSLEDLLTRKRVEVDEALSRAKEENMPEAKMTDMVEQIGKKYKLLQQEAQRSAADDLEEKHSKQQLDLRQAQLTEIANALSHLAPQDILVQKQAEQKQRQVEELAEFRRTMEEEAQERIVRIKREKMEFEEKLRKTNEEELRSMEKAHEEQLEKERAEGDRKLQERKKAYADKQQKQHQMQMAQMGEVDDIQRREILRQFEEEQRRFMGMMSSERDRQLRTLEDKLRARRERHSKKQSDALREDMLREQKLMRERIAHVAETAAKSIAQAEHSAKAATSVFQAMRMNNKMKGAESKVHMAMIGSMAKGWKNKARVAKERRDAISKAAQDMQTPAQRAAARNAQKGFWNSSPELTEEEKAEAEKRSLAEVERLQAAMKAELEANKNDMSEKAKNRHGKLLARLEAKKKRLAKKEERAKKKKDEEDQQQQQQQKKKDTPATAAQDANTSLNDNSGGSGGGATPSMVVPSTPTSKRGGPVGAAMTMNIPTSSNNGSGGFGGGGGGGGGMDPQKEKLLFSRLDEITKTLNALTSNNGGIGISGGALSGSSSSSPLQKLNNRMSNGIDIFSEDRTKDNQFTREGTLKESNVNKLTDHEQQRLGFGHSLLKLYGMDRGSRKVQLVVASSLPTTTNDTVLNNNAFGNSFHYDYEKRILYVREERLESVGDFAMLMVHTLAHISADPRGTMNSMGNDTDPKFVQEFNKGMKMVTQSLFMSSQQVEKLRLIRPNNSGSSSSSSSSSSSNHPNNKKAEEEYYKTASLEERMSRYRAFRNRPELLSFVSSVDGEDEGGSNGSNMNGSSIDGLSARLSSQITDMEQKINGLDRDYKDQLSKSVRV